MKVNTLCLLALVAWCLSTLAGVYTVDDTVVPLDNTSQHYIVIKPSNYDLTGDVSVNDATPMSAEAEFRELVSLARTQSNENPITTMDASGNPYTTFDAFNAALPVEFTYVFESALRGCALKLTPQEAAVLSTFPGVTVIPDGTSDPHTTGTPAFLGLTTGKLWSRSKYGRDVIVGVIDTGVWPESQSFNDTGMGPIPAKWKGVCQVGTRFTQANCNKKLIGARYFSKGHMAAEGIDLTTQVLSPRDVAGHGTFCASTAAGSTVVGASLNGFAAAKAARGMAFGARLAVYKVCWRTCYDSDILAAYDQAVKDGVDVISVSLGGSQNRYEKEINSVAAFGAMKAGIFVAQSAGNSGGTRSTVTNVAPWVMTVGASTLDRNFYVSIRLGNGVVLQGVSWTPGPKVVKVLVLASKVAAKGADSGSASNCVQGTLNAALLKKGGQMVVCRNDFGYNSVVEKGVAVLAAGGKGVIILDEVDPSPEHHVLPAVHVGSAVGAAIVAYMKKYAANPTAMLYPTTVTGVKPAPAVASFSSRGPSMYNPQILKPDILAPGVSILGAWQQNSSASGIATDPTRIKFNILSGTSMSCPHISGLAALLRGARPTWSPAMIKSALMTTASIMDNRTPSQVLADLWTSGTATPFDYGAGHVMPELALNPGLVYDIGPNDYINYLCAVGYTSQQCQTFTGFAVTCPTNPPPRVEDFNYPTFSATFAAGKPLAVTFTRTVTNVGAPTATYQVAVQAPAGAKIVVTPTKLVFAPQTKSLKFSVRVTMSKPTEGFGSVTWTDGTIVVRSPVVITAAAA